MEQDASTATLSLTELASEPGLQEYSQDLERLQRLHDQRLWKQLTDGLTWLFGLPGSQAVRERVFEDFILHIGSKLNALRLVELGLSAYAGLHDPAAVIGKLERLVERAGIQHGDLAYVFVRTEIARQTMLRGDIAEAKSVLDACSKDLDRFDSVEPAVHAAYYRVLADYYKARAEYSSYYSTSLLYFACVDMAQLSPAEIHERAVDISIAALLGDIYNFGELLLHPIFDHLRNTPDAYLCDLLQALNSGDVKRFEQLGSSVAANALLAASAGFLRQKICLMTLIEIIFQRPPTDRILPFALIAREAYLPENEVEHLVMKALSLGIVRGSIDQVGRVIRITWVQPRVLNLAQVESMRDRLIEWESSVQQTARYTDAQGKEIWTA